MSQYKKDEINRRILKVAKTIFVKQGYLNASLRTICDKAQISLSNLYNYYPSKDDLFFAILTPLLNDIEKIFSYGKLHLESSKAFESIEDKEKNIRVAFDYVIKNKSELRLLFKLSAGSRLENYPDYLSKKYQENWDLFFETLKQKYPNTTYKKPSSPFLQMMASFFITSAIKIIDEDLKKNEIDSLIKEISLFFWHGGMGLVNNLR